MGEWIALKKLTFISLESVFSGVIQSGMAEMIDSLANSLSNEYQVSILCPYGKGVLVTNAAKVTLFKKGIRYSRFS